MTTGRTIKPVNTPYFDSFTVPVFKTMHPTQSLILCNLNHILCILLAMGPTPLTWVGCRRVESKPYLTHLPCYSCIFSNFNSPSCIIYHCHFYFLSSCLLLEVIVGYSHPFIQKELGLHGPNTLYWIKKVLDPVDPNLLESFCRTYVLNFLLGEKFRPLNEMLGNQTETQLWTLEMTPIGFRCDDKPIQARRNKNCT